MRTTGWWLVAMLAGSAGQAAAQDCGGTGLQADCDGDGFDLEAGDCDDDDPEVRPGATEACGDEIDNDCDGLLDEACDRSAQLGQVRGGGGCTGGAGVAGTTAVLVLPLLWRRRRTA